MSISDIHCTDCNSSTLLSSVVLHRLKLAIVLLCVSNEMKLTITKKKREPSRIHAKEIKGRNNEFSDQNGWEMGSYANDDGVGITTVLVYCCQTFYRCCSSLFCFISKLGWCFFFLDAIPSPVSISKDCVHINRLSCRNSTRFTVHWCIPFPCCVCIRFFFVVVRFCLCMLIVVLYVAYFILIQRRLFVECSLCVSLVLPNMENARGTFSKRFVGRYLYWCINVFTKRVRNVYFDQAIILPNKSTQI